MRHMPSNFFSSQTLVNSLAAAAAVEDDFFKDGACTRACLARLKCLSCHQKRTFQVARSMTVASKLVFSVGSKLSEGPLINYELITTT